jgi:hypothetical protein
MLACGTCHVCKAFTPVAHALRSTLRPSVTGLPPPKKNQMACCTSPCVLALPLTLLLWRNHLVGRVGILFWRARRPLLGNLAPPSSTFVVSSRGRRNTIGGRVHDALISQLATSHKFFGKATSVESLRVRIDRVRNDLCVKRK